MAMLGLGDIIIPGYIIVHGFTMYGMEEMTRIKYGFVCLCGQFERIEKKNIFVIAQATESV